MLASPNGLSRQHLTLERKPLAFLPPPHPHVHTLHRERVHFEGRNSLRTGHPRLRPAVTHYYSEMVTAHPDSSPFVRDGDSGMWRSLSFWCCNQRKKFPENSSGPRAQGGRIQNANTTRGIPPQADRQPTKKTKTKKHRGRDGARAPPRGQRWHRPSNHCSCVHECL